MSDDPERPKFEPTAGHYALAIALAFIASIVFILAPALLLIDLLASWPGLTEHFWLIGTAATFAVCVYLWRSGRRW
jgi:hypothetical protein